MARIRRLCLSLLVLLWASAGSAERTINREEYFSIVLPDGFRLEKQYAVDFVVYRVTDGKLPYVGIYIGEAPQDAAAPLAGETQETFLAPRMRLTSTWRAKDLQMLEILIQRSDLGDSPNYIHAWTIRDVADKQLAQRILMSLTVFDKCSYRSPYGFC